MKRWRFAACIIMLLMVVTLCACQNVNHNRYGTLALDNDILYYYANGYVYRYKDGKSEKYEKADSIHFEVLDGKIVYDNEESTDEDDTVPESLTTPYDDQLEGAYSIVYTNERVYARFPDGDSRIEVYEIMDEGELKNIDTIEY